MKLQQIRARQLNNEHQRMQYNYAESMHQMNDADLLILGMDAKNLSHQ
jgi:hypothetical protein